jgi:hypothetical protein
MAHINPRFALVSRSLNLQDTLRILPGPVQRGYPWIELRFAPAMHALLMANLLVDAGAPREQSYLSANPGLRVQTLVFDELLQLLRETGEQAVAELGEYRIGQAFRLQVDVSETDATLSLVGAEDGHRIALGDLERGFVDAFAERARHALRESLRKQCMLLSGRELMDLVHPAVVPATLRDPDLVAIYVSDTLRPMARLKDARQRLLWQVSPALREHLAYSGLIYGSEGLLGQEYTFELLAGRGLFVRYQRISVQRHIAMLTDDEFCAFIDRAELAVRAANGEVATHTPRTPAVIPLPERAVAAIPAQAPSRLPSRTPSASATVEAVPTTPRDPVLVQLRMLRAEGDRILLPDNHLSEYAAIKERLANAGFSYKKQKGVMFFQAPAGTDAAAVLEQLATGERVNVHQETQFFATPAELARELVEGCGVAAGSRFLEPSAGAGALADVARERGAEVIVVETWDVNARALRDKGYSPIERDFLDVRPEDIGGLVDAIAMNPPFTRGQDMLHVRHALSFLNPDGVLCAITSCRAGLNSSRAHRQFADLLEVAGADRQEIASGTFSTSGTDVATSVIRIAMADLLDELRRRDLTGEDIGVDLSAVLAERDRPADHEERPRPRC